MFRLRRDTGVALVTDRSDHPGEGLRPRRAGGLSIERELHLLLLPRAQFDLEVTRPEPRVRRAEDVLPRRDVDQFELAALVGDGEVGVIDDAEVATLPRVHVASDGDEDLGV